MDSPIHSDDESVASDRGEIEDEKEPQTENVVKSEADSDDAPAKTTKISTTPSEQVKAARLPTHTRTSTDPTDKVSFLGYI